MEERVEETMSTCDMNVLLTESNSVALVEATARSPGTLSRASSLGFICFGQGLAMHALVWPNG